MSDPSCESIRGGGGSRGRYPLHPRSHPITLSHPILWPALNPAPISSIRLPQSQVTCNAILAVRHANSRNGTFVPALATIPVGHTFTAASFDTGNLPPVSLSRCAATPAPCTTTPAPCTPRVAGSAQQVPCHGMAWVLTMWEDTWRNSPRNVAQAMRAQAMPCGPRQATP